MKHPALRIVGEEVGLAAGFRIGVSHGAASSAGRPECAFATLPFIIFSLSETPEHLRSGPDVAQRCLADVSYSDPDAAAGHYRPVAGDRYAGETGTAARKGENAFR